MSSKGNQWTVNFIIQNIYVGQRGLKGLYLLYRKVKRQIKCLMIERWLVYYAIVVGNKLPQISRHHLKIDVSNPI